MSSPRTVVLIQHFSNQFTISSTNGRHGMSEKINWNFSAQALKGPAISGAGSLDVEGYEKKDFRITKSGGTHPVTMTGFGAVSLLIISSDSYDPLITYTGIPELAITTCELDGPHIFMGKVASDFLNADTVITFTNNTDKDVEIQILVGRKTV
jgi:hypothetical protein